MIKERIDDLVDILTEEYAKLENSFVIRNNEQLARFMDDPSTWKQKQLAKRYSYQKNLLRGANNLLKEINDKTERVFLLAYKETDKDSIEITEKEIVVKDLDKKAKQELAELKKFNAKELKNLTTIATQTFTKTVRLIQPTKTPEQFYNVIKSQMRKGVENGLKVVYKDKKQFTWKAYMEMNVRTTLQQEMSKRAIEVGAKVGQIFYIVDSFADCADDHADYQGKIYYNAEATIPEEIREYIESNNIMSMQEVSEQPPYLTNRPNCRHNFHAISNEEAMGGNTEKVLEDNGFKFGEYDKSNYQDLQKQRYNERMIRKYKLQAENNAQLAKQMGKSASDLVAYNKANEKVHEWQKKQRELIKSNPKVLERNYERESAKTMVYNLGVKYDYKLIDGEMVKR